MSNVPLAVGLALLAGILNGSFATPMKYAKYWKWENIWSVWAVVGMLMFPWFMVYVTVPHMAGFYQQAGLREILRLVGFGVGFGLAQIFFGLGIAALGIALNFAIAIGLSTALGSLVPLVALHSEMIFTTKGMVIILGVTLMLVGIVFCAVAGRHKEKAMQSSAQEQQEGATKKMSFKAGLFICILAGVGSPLINFGLAFGAPLISRAAQLGVSPRSQTNVIWAPLVTASLVPYLIYCTYLWKKNKSAHVFFHPGTAINWILGAMMGVLWFGSTVIYGASTAELAGLGPVLGWPLFMSSIIITSNVWGFVTGEWKTAGQKALTTMLAGILFLILGFVTLAVSGRLAGS
jgi:L-rhamnose-H+ transport protein